MPLKLCVRIAPCGTSCTLWSTPSSAAQRVMLDKGVSASTLFSMQAVQISCCSMRWQGGSRLTQRREHVGVGGALARAGAPAGAAEEAAASCCQRAAALPTPVQLQRVVGAAAGPAQPAACCR